MAQDQLGLFDTPPNRQQIRFSLFIVGLLFAALLLIVPVRDIRLHQFDAFIPMIGAIMFLGELITATLLYAQAAVFRSRALTVLASGYVFTALLLVPHALTFPGAFAPNGLLDAGINTTGWLANFQRAAFPIAIILYVQLKRADAAVPPGPERPPARILAGVSAAIVLAAAVTILATSGHDCSAVLQSSDVIIPERSGQSVFSGSSSSRPPTVPGHSSVLTCGCWFPFRLADPVVLIMTSRADSRLAGMACIAAHSPTRRHVCLIAESTASISAGPDHSGAKSRT